jgi:uncharacterized protein YciW
MQTKEIKIDAQKMMDCIIEQRNEALNRLAQMTAYARQLEETTKPVEIAKQGD